MKTLGIGLFALLLTACTGGSGGLPGTIVEGYENHPGSFESPGERREAPPSGGGGGGGSTETPSSSGSTSTGSQGSSSSQSSSGTSSSNCLTCTTYNCTTTSNGQTQQSQLTLTQAPNGGCVISGNLVLACDGAIQSNGQSAGNWSRVGNGFSVSGNGTSVTCTR